MPPCIAGVFSPCIACICVVSPCIACIVVVPSCIACVVSPCIACVIVVAVAPCIDCVVGVVVVARDGVLSSRVGCSEESVSGTLGSIVGGSVGTCVIL